jgi:hypothetical protein
MKLTPLLIVGITKHFGLCHINEDFNTLRLMMDAKLEEFNEMMLPNKSTDTNIDFIIPKEIVKSYIELMGMQDELMRIFEEVEV